jgi:hypothetical protein
MVRRAVGLLLAVVGALGMLMSLAGIVVLWREAPGVVSAAEGAVGVVAETLLNVEQALDVAAGTLDGVETMMGTLSTTTLGVGETLSATQASVSTIAALAEDNLPDSIDATLVALDGLEQTLGVVDQTMRGLTRLGVSGYAPEVPPDTAIAAARAGLEPVPESLRDMGAGLRQTAVGLAEVQGGVDEMAHSVVDFHENGVRAQGAIADQLEVMRELRIRVEAFRPNVARLTRLALWAAALVLVWVGFSQLALVQLALGMRREVVFEEEEDERREE